MCLDSGIGSVFFTFFLSIPLILSDFRTLNIIYIFRLFFSHVKLLLQEDWRKEKRDFLQSLSRISTLPKKNISDSSPGVSRYGQIVPAIPSPQVSSSPSGMKLAALGSKHVLEKKAVVYAEVVKNLNSAREHGRAFKVSFLSSSKSLNSLLYQKPSVYK